MKNNITSTVRLAAWYVFTGVAIRSNHERQWNMPIWLDVPLNIRYRILTTPTWILPYNIRKFIRLQR